jgi:hypothetical protein
MSLGTAQDWFVLDRALSRIEGYPNMKGERVRMFPTDPGRPCYSYLK